MTTNDMCAELDKKVLDSIREQLLEPDDLEVAAEFFKAFADKTRLSIVNALSVHPGLCVTELACMLGISKSALSHQLSYLRLNKLVKVKRDGKKAHYSLNDDHVEKVFDMAVSHIKE